MKESRCSVKTSAYNYETHNYSSRNHYRYRSRSVIISLELSTELILLLEIRGNWKAFFQAGKSQGIWHLLQKSGNFDDLIYFFYILMTQYIFITDCIESNVIFELHLISNKFL